MEESNAVGGSAREGSAVTVPRRAGPRFSGTALRSVDDKSRLVLPPAYREGFAAGGFMRRVEGSVALWPPEEMDRMRAHLIEQGRQGLLTNRNALRALAANAPRFVPDGQGRIPFPTEWRTTVGIDTEVLVAGVGNAVELWAPARWDEISIDGELVLADHWSTFGL